MMYVSNKSWWRHWGCKNIGFFDGGFNMFQPTQWKHRCRRQMGNHCNPHWFGVKFQKKNPWNILKPPPQKLNIPNILPGTLTKMPIGPIGVTSNKPPTVDGFWCLCLVSMISTRITPAGYHWVPISKLFHMIRGNWTTKGSKYLPIHPRSLTLCPCKMMLGKLLTSFWVMRTELLNFGLVYTWKYEISLRYHPKSFKIAPLTSNNGWTKLHLFPLWSYISEPSHWKLCASHIGTF